MLYALQVGCRTLCMCNTSRVRACR